MSDYIYDVDEEIKSKISLVVRKPQEGKTFICITYITQDKTTNIHIVMTMNTLGAGMQFFGRMEEEIGSKNIIVFNSKKETAGNCHHAKNVDEIFKLIMKYPNIKVIVCCAHEARFRTKNNKNKHLNSIPTLLQLAEDSFKFMKLNRKFNIHVDEAHKYFVENVESIRDLNSYSIVESIIGYSGTPFNIWSEKASDPLFYKILIRDVDAELAIIRSPHYFGVGRCSFNILDISCDELLKKYKVDEILPVIVATRANTTKKQSVLHGKNFPFQLGNEIVFLSYINHILPKMRIDLNCFSYHYIPGYKRIATHYYITELILKYYPTANVIVINGNGIELFRVKGETYKVKTGNQLLDEYKSTHEHKKLLEPSYMIQQLIKDTCNSPTFVTGFDCVGMSITLINENIGNFDSVVMDHNHYLTGSQYSLDILYQLCRFVFNYINWSEESRTKIKETTFYSFTKNVIDACFHYEENVERLCTEFAGKSCTLREIRGLGPEEPTEREQKKNALHSITIMNPKIWKKFKVYDGNEDEEWDKVNKFYKEIMKKNIGKKSKPKMINGFWHCSTTGKVDKHTIDSINKLDKQSWWSTFQLLDRLSYARLFVGYENVDDPTEYTIYVKYVQLDDNEETHRILQLYGKNIDKYIDNSDDEL